jgi:transposase-like protein
MRDVAESLGIAPWSLHRWARAYERDGQFHPVQIVDDAAAGAETGLVVVVQADGLRVEGLDVTAAAQLLRLLR